MEVAEEFSSHKLVKDFTTSLSTQSSPSAEAAIAAEAGANGKKCSIIIHSSVAF